MESMFEVIRPRGKFASIVTDALIGTILKGMVNSEDPLINKPAINQKQ
jgi:hypothetical protein